MKLVLLLLLTLLLKLHVAGPPAVRVTFSPLMKAAYEQAKKAVIVTKPTLTFPLNKQNGRIVIPTAKGPKVFQDIIKEMSLDNQEQFSYLGFDAQLKYHLVEDRFNGGYRTRHTFHLVGANGQHVVLPGMPVYSRDVHWLVTASDGTNVLHSTVSVELHRFDNGHWRQVWKLAHAEEAATWATDEAWWLSNSTLLLKKRMWTGEKTGNTFTYAKLTIQ